jgi:hypothetical protein
MSILEVREAAREKSGGRRNVCRVRRAWRSARSADASAVSADRAAHSADVPAGAADRAARSADA